MRRPVARWMVGVTANTVIVIGKCDRVADRISPGHSKTFAENGRCWVDVLFRIGLVVVVLVDLERKAKSRFLKFDFVTLGKSCASSEWR